jgi:hypothetical protein
MPGEARTLKEENMNKGGTQKSFQNVVDATKLRTQCSF